MPWKYKVRDETGTTIYLGIKRFTYNNYKYVQKADYIVMVPDLDFDPDVWLVQEGGLPHLREFYENTHNKADEFLIFKRPFQFVDPNTLGKVVMFK